MNINLNEYVKVKLTDYGEQIHYGNYIAKGVSFCMKHKYRPPLIDEQGYSKFQLWDLMNIFGSVMYLGNPNVPFEGNEIVYDK